MFVDFFIHRPVFATVCALLIILAGAICIPNLPVAMYPTLAPPVVQVAASYVGANAETVEKAVTIPLEESINGVEGMRYISSSSTNSGVSLITITFQTGYDLDTAAVDVQNRVASAEGRLPGEVISTGISITKANYNFVFAAGFFTRDGRYSSEFISNYIDIYVKDALKRIPGVGDVMIFGERKYAMRVWLDPVRMAARSLTASDVLSALNEQNVEIPAGQLGQPPSNSNQAFEIPVRVVGRLTSPAAIRQCRCKELAEWTGAAERHRPRGDWRRRLTGLRSSIRAIRQWVLACSCCQTPMLSMLTDAPRSSWHACRRASRRAWSMRLRSIRRRL